MGDTGFEIAAIRVDDRDYEDQWDLYLLPPHLVVNPEPPYTIYGLDELPVKGT